MVLDGQQRIQSLLLAIGGDSWGFRMFDRDWRIALTDEKPRGRQGIRHWSLGCLCLDLEALASEYAKTRRIAALDYTGILKWVVTGGKAAQSEYRKLNYTDPLPISDAHGSSGRYVRLGRLWDAAPGADGVEQEQAEESALALLKEHGVAEDRQVAMQRPVGSLLLTLARVKRTRVTYLELAEFDERFLSRENYNDAVVNIFTRLNTGGRILTREDITFAWLKVGWKPEKTGNRSAAKCFDDLGDDLEEHKIEIPLEDLVSGVSFVWSVAHGGGRLLNNNDLLRGETIRPMAGDLSDNWETTVSAILDTSALVAERGIIYRKQYQSLNSLFVLWAWHYIADLWLSRHPLKELEKDGFIGCNRVIRAENRRDLRFCVVIGG